MTAVKPLIKKDVTQTTRIIEAEDIASMPRDTVNGILQTLPGGFGPQFDRFHFMWRGGQINGGQVSDWTVSPSVNPIGGKLGV